MNHDDKPVLNNKAFIGIPECLLPGSDDKAHNPYEIVREGIRDLKKRPLDYRNPHAVKPYEKMNSLQDSYATDITKPNWPIDDSHAVFDYYSNGNAVIGLPGGPECALIDIHGTLRCFTGAWALTLGEDCVVPDIRNRHLLQGYIPVVLGETRINGIEYRFEYFASEIADSPLCNYPITGKQWVGSMQPKGRNIFLCMNCSAKTLDDEHQKPIIHLGYAQRAGLCAGAFYARPTFAPAWENVRYERIDDGRFRLLATSSGKDYTLGLLILHHANLNYERTGFHHWPKPLSASSERTAVSYMVASRAESAVSEISCTWIIPFFPMETKDDACMLQAELTQLREGCICLWEKRRSNGMQIRIPEEKVQDTFIQTLNHMDMCCIALDQTEYPTAGASGNHHIFYDQDGTDMIYAYDMIGEQGRAERMMDSYLLRNIDQQSCGAVLWLYGKHYTLTRNKNWAGHIFADVVRRMSWLINTWAEQKDDNEGLLPATSIADNELIEGHIVSYHLYSVAGVKASVLLAGILGFDVLASQWNEFYQTFSSAVLSNLEKLVIKTGGVITPGFEGYEAKPVTCVVHWVEKPYSYVANNGSYGVTGGVDWYNDAAVHPTDVLAYDHPWVLSSLERWRHIYTEGLCTYACNSDYTRLHIFKTMNLSETWLRRGDYLETIRDLYGLLLHTTGTHGMAESTDSTERYDFDCIPAGTSNGKFVRFIRDLLVYEGQDKRVHLLGCLSPAWLIKGMIIALKNAATEFGSISFEIEIGDHGFNMRIDFDAVSRETEIVIHLPPS